MGKKDVKEASPKKEAVIVEKPSKAPAVNPKLHVPTKPKGCMELLSLLASQDEFPDQADLADALLVFKSLIAVVLGVAMGLLRVEGGTGIQTFAFASVGGSVVMVRQWLKKEDEEVGGVQKVIMDGLMPSVALFILVWSVINTVIKVTP